MQLPPLPTGAAAHVQNSEELQLEKEPIQIRETGFWLWKRIIIPPNAMSCIPGSP